MSVLNVPKVERVRYRKNFIKTAVCELRFPTLLALETEAPRAFQAAIRKQYPHYDREIDLDVGPGPVEGKPRYVFRSKDRQWTVGVKSFAIALETSKYVDFEDFVERLSKLMDAARTMIDADFFTRVGLRYINSIPVEDRELQDWIRPELFPPIGGVLGSVDKYVSLIQGYLENGRYALRQSLKTDEAEDSVPPMPSAFIIDTDYFKENVELAEVPDLVRYFNETNFSFFTWSIGRKALASLGEGKPK